MIAKTPKPEKQIIKEIAIYKNDNMPWSNLSSAGKVNLSLQNKSLRQS